MVNYFIIEGCIGSGKTTVAKSLSNRLKTNILLENFDKNPFLEKFYLNHETYAFETELAFLLLHYHQLKELMCNDKNVNLISDFYIKKDWLFAKLNLNQEELSVFLNVFDFIIDKIPNPDLVICLHTSNDLILDRIKKRNREIEQKIDTNYFVNLNNQYEIFFQEIELPKIHINMDEKDFIKDKSCIDWLDNEIQNLGILHF